ncbi:GNAT family N-acetyltransferase [Plesiomonas shigelloides]|uniref:GNAT family N-acetyltransferase n=1 Tax=Plesiomonas shigelloides TaxID=703 RepID=UPI0022487304|nr:GNAT family N-acetyltransferase [Plesiomonas shigelloides]MCX2532206.1 GNAT family N-acetyltransferase [Plesiomonas shigelloides]
MKIYQAAVQDAAKVAPLYVQYREFYQVDPMPEQALAFMQARLQFNQSVIFYAVNDAGEAVGFAQLYPAFCSLQMKPVWWLYDLFVTPSARRQGVGEALLARCKVLGEETDAGYIMLQTAHDNTRAQSLYEKEGYIRDNEFYSYNLWLQH